MSSLSFALSADEQQAAEDAAELIALRAEKAATQWQATATPPAASATTPAKPPPLRGGILANGDVWTGGGLAGSPHRLFQPMSPSASRPTDTKGKNYAFKECTAQFPQSNQYDTDATSQVKLTSYVRELETYLEITGQDGVFIVKHPKDGVERNILKYSGMYTIKDVADHVANLRITGDQYDADNLLTSGMLMLNSIGPNLKGEIEKHLHGGDTKTGPYVFILIMQRIVSSSSSSWRALTRELETLDITTEPGENVEAFADKISRICRVLEGANKLPDDVSSIVAQTFTTSRVPQFANKFMGIFGDLDDHSKTLEWGEVVLKATSLYQTLKQQKRWTVDLPRGAPAGLASELVSTDGSTTMTCHNCGVAGHLARNCPKAAKDPWKSTPPSAGGQQTMTKFDKKYYWCGACKHWNLTHLTGEHKPGGGKRRGGGGGTDAKTPDAVVPTPPVAAVSTPTPQPTVTPAAPTPTPSGLVMQQGFMCGFVGGITTEGKNLDGYESSWTYGPDEHGELVRCQGPHNKKPKVTTEHDSHGGLWSSSEDDDDDDEDYVDDDDKIEVKPAKKQQAMRFLDSPPGHGLFDDTSDSEDDFDDAVEFMNEVEDLDRITALKD